LQRHLGRVMCCPGGSSWGWIGGPYGCSEGRCAQR
jgi:hypothetical protein